MYYAKLLVGMSIYGLIATALPVMQTKPSITPTDIANILSAVALEPRRTEGAWKTSVPGGEYDDPEDGPDNDDDGDNDDDNDGGDDDDGDVIPEAFLEGDVDAGGESDIGNDAVGVASGLTGQGGAGSTALNSKSQGATSVFCTLFACASAAESDGQVSTAASGAHINATGPLITIKGPLISINASRKSMSYVYKDHVRNGTSSH